MIHNIDYLDEILSKFDTHDLLAKISLLQNAVNSYPDDPRLLLLLAGIWVQSQQLDRAEATYIDILRISPSYAIARFQLGLLQFTSGRPAAAFATWKPLDQLEERDPLRLFKRAFAHLAQDQFDAAILSYPLIFYEVISMHYGAVDKMPEAVGSFILNRLCSARLEYPPDSGQP